MRWGLEDAGDLQRVLMNAGNADPGLLAPTTSDAQVVGTHGGHLIYPHASSASENSVTATVA
jgi:hypothetical protein